MSARQDAIIEIIDTIKRHGLSLEEITAALNNTTAHQAKSSNSILSRVFGYIGGIFVFVGLAIYVSMQWHELNAMSRILLTLGSGFCTFILALVCTGDEKFERAATPLFLVAAIFEAIGILVVLKEFSHGGDPAYGLLFLHLVMTIQQGIAFYTKQRTVLALTTIYFALGFFAIAFDLLHIERHLIGLVIGASLLCIGWSIDRSRHKPLAAIVYFLGSALFLAVAYDWLNYSPLKFLFPTLSCATIFLSTVARSRTLLLVGTLALIGYIGNYMAEHFAHNLAGPVGLITAGLLLIGAGAAAMRINNKYISQARG
jgi:predicted membrane protein DUF2157